MADELTPNVTNPATPGPAPATPPHPDLTRPPVGATGGPPVPPTVPLTVDEYQRLRGIERQLDEYRTAQQRALDEKEQARLQALADKGKVQEALEEQRKSWESKHNEAITKYAALETQIVQERKAT